MRAPPVPSNWLAGTLNILSFFIIDLSIPFGTVVLLYGFSNQCPKKNKN
jgi:hypothetical protein